MGAARGSHRCGWGPPEAAIPFAMGAAEQPSHLDGGRWRQPSSGGSSVSRVVGLSGFEPLTSRLSAVRSSQLSYRPVDAARQPSALLDLACC